MTGKTVGENIEDAKVINAEVIRPLENPVHNEGGIAIFTGNFAPKGAVVKMAAVSPKMKKHKVQQKFTIQSAKQEAMNRHEDVGRRRRGHPL